MKRLYNHYFPTPSYLATKSCALNISDQSIKYGELIPTSSGLRLGRFGKEPIASGIVVSGKIERENDLVDILKKIKQKQKLNFVRVSLPEEQVYLFTVNIPIANKKNIREVILLQLEEYIPIKAADSAFDFSIISEDNQNISVEVVAIAITTLESYLSVLNKAELLPLSFEIESQAIARAVIPSEDNSPVMVVDFGDVRTGVSISKNGRVFLTTTLLIGGMDLTNMIAKNFSLSFEEAKKMKHRYGLDKISKAEDIFPAILNGISVLRDELNKQYTYWETHNVNNKKHEKISRIIICGGDANLAGLADYLELSMKIKVESANVWTNILDPKDDIPEMSFEESLSYATVLGLCLGGYIYKSQPVINILPYEEKKLRHREYWTKFITMFMNLITLAGILAVLLLFPSYFFSDAKEKLVEQRLEVFNKENPNLDTNNADKIIGDINSKLKILEKGQAQYQISDKVIDNILSSRTNGITFSQILFNKKTQKTGDTFILDIHGTALNRDSLRNFKTTLDTNPNFAKVDLPISNFLEKADLDFTISITMK